jgi:hypothetical protein
MHDREEPHLVRLPEFLPDDGPTAGSDRPTTSLCWDAGTLVAVDRGSGRSVRLTPASLYHYRYKRTILNYQAKRESQEVYGLAALDADGLVLLDLPGWWSPHRVAAFVAVRGIPVYNALTAPSEQVRAVLAGRAPGWKRLMTGTVSRMSPRLRKIAAYSLGVAGLLVMIFLTTTVGSGAWRGLSFLGRLLVDLFDAKLLGIFFVPLIMIVRPVHRAWHRGRIRRGNILGPPGGPCLSLKGKKTLRFSPGPRMAPDHIAMGPGAGTAANLLLYRYADLSGLFILSRVGSPLRHLPGPWPPEDAHRFAVQQNLGFTLRNLSRDEYLHLVSHTRDAFP